MMGSSFHRVGRWILLTLIGLFSVVSLGSLVAGGIEALFVQSPRDVGGGIVVLVIALVFVVSPSIHFIFMVKKNALNGSNLATWTLISCVVALASVVLLA